MREYIAKKYDTGQVPAAAALCVCVDAMTRWMAACAGAGAAEGRQQAAGAGQFGTGERAGRAA